MNQEEQKNWRVVQIRTVLRALLLFLGVLLMQLLASMVCVVVYILVQGAKNHNMVEAAKILTGQMQSSTFLMWVSIVSAAMSLVWCGVLYYRSDWRKRDFSYRQAFSVKNVSGLAAVGIGGCIVLSFALTLLAGIWPEFFQKYNQVMNQFQTGDLAVTMLYVLLIGPAAEEMIFRGAMLDRFYLAFPFWIANAFQASLFGLYHMNLIQGIYAFCLGLILGLVRQVTGSIFAAMATHIMFNGTSYLLGVIFPENAPVNPGLFWGIFILGIVLYGGGLWYYVKEYKK